MNIWTHLWDHYGNQLRESAGIPEPEIVQSLYVESWNLGSGRFFEHQLAQLDEIASRGIKRLVLHTLPHPHYRRNCCAHYDYTILDSEGGMAALRAFTDAARQRDIEVYGWAGGSLSVRSPLIKENPHWTIQEPSGRRFDGGYPGTLVALDFAHPEVQNWYIDRMKTLLHEGGIAGMWMDSWMNLHAFGVDQKRPLEYGGPGPHLDGLIQVMKTLSDEGMRFITEGVSPLGLSAGNLGRGFVEGTAATGKY